MSKLVRVERIVRRHFGGLDDTKGEREVLRRLEVGLGIKFHESGPSWPIDWSKRLRASQEVTELCDFSALALRDKRIDMIVTFDSGGSSRMLAETLARRTARLSHRAIDTYTVQFAREIGQTRLRRVISYDGDPRSAIAEQRLFLLGDVLEQNCYILRLAKEIAIYARKVRDQPRLIPTIVGIGAPVVRDFGIKEHIKELLGYVPELHYLVHARQHPRQTSGESLAKIFSLEEIRHQRSTATSKPQ